MAEIKESKKEEEKVRYSSFSMRLHEGTIELLKLEQQKSGKSWNKFIYNLLKKNA